MSARARLSGAVRRIRLVRPFRLEGRVVKVVGMTIESEGPHCTVGEECLLLDADQRPVSRAQVVGFADRNVLSTPIDPPRGLAVGSRVVALGRWPQIGVGPGLLGRVLDSDGKPLDDRPAVDPETVFPLENDAPAALNRDRIGEPFVTGVRAIDGLLTLGRGQRIGITSGSGVGKSTLLGMIARHARADAVVIGLVGERGREVRDFLEDDLGRAGLERSVVFVATSNEPPMRRIRAAQAATAAAEYLRAQGKHVLLLMDSLTRVAMAQREIGLAAGEPPSSKGYPPSVFSLLPRLLERAGSLRDGGSITALYTVYAEADDVNEPIADASRSLLDGHVVLSRELAARGHWPAIDVLDSVSRVMPAVAGPEHLAAATVLRARLAAHRDAEDLIMLGAYREGSVAEVDAALATWHSIQSFLRQQRDDRSALDDTLEQLAALAQTPPALADAPGEAEAAS